MAKKKPAPCIGCGWCCMTGPCLVAGGSHLLKGKPWRTGAVCEHLVWDKEQQRHWCCQYKWRELMKNVFMGHNDNCIMPDNPWRRFALMVANTDRTAVKQ